MKRLLVLFIFISSIAKIDAGFIAYFEKTFYWECSIAFDPYTGIPLVSPGNGQSIAEITFIAFRASGAKIGNQEFNLTFREETQKGCKIYDTQFPARKIWVFNDDNQKFTAILDVTYLNGKPIHANRYIPEKGVVSGNQGGGYGSYPNNGNRSGSNSNSSSTYKTCPSCSGTGICSSCHGSGGEWRDTGYYTGSNSKSWISCPSCKGSKRCFNCHGSGKI